MVYDLLFLSQTIVFNSVPLFFVIYILSNIYKYKISISVIIFLYIWGGYFCTSIYSNITILSSLLELVLVIIWNMVDWLIVVLPIAIYFLVVSQCMCQDIQAEHTQPYCYLWVHFQFLDS